MSSRLPSASFGDFISSCDGSRLGRYELLRQIGRGGMADVYLARLTGTAGFSRHLVVKRIQPRFAADEEAVTMFLDEARLIAMLHHQHIAPVHELGLTDDGTYFLAMEYVHGESLRAALGQAQRQRRVLPFELGITVAMAAAAGLHHAHEQRTPEGQPLQIVHRDVSPANVLLGHDGAIKVIDFGIAKAMGRLTRTAVGSIKSKAGYMAPEQILGGPVDRRADVFGLGVLLYEATTQRRAFAARCELDDVRLGAQLELRPPSQVRPAFPTMLEDVIMTATAPEPAARFADAAAFERAVDSTDCTPSR